MLWHFFLTDDCFDKYFLICQRRKQKSEWKNIFLHDRYHFDQSKYFLMNGFKFFHAGEILDLLFPAI